MSGLVHSYLFLTRSGFSAISQSEISRIKAAGFQAGLGLDSQLKESRDKWKAQLKLAPSKLINRCYMVRTSFPPPRLRLGF